MAGKIHMSGVPEWLQTAAIGKSPRRTLLRVALLVGIALVPFLCLKFVFLPVQITGPSMSPTFYNGSINFINRLAYLRHEPRRGDVVAIRFSGKDLMLVKRIIGMPGEAVSFDNGKAYVNGTPLAEPYLPHYYSDWNAPAKLLGPQEYYVVGDNRTMPFENHEKGGAQRNRIIGKIILGGGA